MSLGNVNSICISKVYTAMSCTKLKTSVDKLYEKKLCPLFIL